VNPASAAASCDAPWQRGRASQPDSTFPQLPGIILETAGRELLPESDAILRGQRSSFGLVAGPSSGSRRLDFE